jgi:hypothetical protein
MLHTFSWYFYAEQQKFRHSDETNKDFLGMAVVAILSASSYPKALK